MDTNKYNQNNKEPVKKRVFSTHVGGDDLQKQALANEVNKNMIEDEKIVADLVRKSNRILVTISSHRFPFDFFPDTLNVEESRVTIITRSSFFSSQVHSVDIKDISNIFMNKSYFFAQLVIVSKTFTKNEIKLNKLRIEEAVFARRIIEGLRTIISKQIDTSNYTKEELINILKELSTTEIVT